MSAGVMSKAPSLIILAGSWDLSRSYYLEQLPTCDLWMQPGVPKAWCLGSKGMLPKSKSWEGAVSYFPIYLALRAS